MLKVIDVTSRYAGIVDLRTTMKDPDRPKHFKVYHIGFYRDYEIPERFLERTVCLVRVVNDRLVIQMNGDTQKGE